MPLAGIAVAGALVVGCGDKESDPDAVTVDELKGPGKLWIQDQGDGAVTLNWTGSNNEDDFDGYNVYGVKTAAPGQPATVGGLAEGNALQLLDDDGEPVEAAKTTLAAFNYNPDNGLGLAAPMSDNFSLQDAAEGEEEEEAEFEALPIHKKNGEERLLPTCKHDGAGKCMDTTAANEGQTVEDNNTLYAVNGPISYSLTGLKVGSTYCFLVLSTFDRGEEVSQSSSNMACVTPKYAKEVAITLPTSDDASTFLKLDFNAWIDACATAADGKCPDPGTMFDEAGDTAAHKASDPGPIYVEYSDNIEQPVFVAGKNHAIADLGYYESGFSDPTLPKSAPTLVLDKNSTKSPTDTAARGPISNQGGYSIAGQSITIAAGHVYVFAISKVAEGDESVPEKFHYVWAYVADPATGKVQFRIPKDQQ
jgi:hypothetical protein